MAYGHTISFLRRGAGQELMVAVNQGDTPSQIPVAPWWKNSYTLIGTLDENGCLPPLSCLVRVRSVKEEDISQPPEDTPSEKDENI